LPAAFYGAGEFSLVKSAGKSPLSGNYFSFKIQKFFERFAVFIVNALRA
jgi:hypothetical protein